MVNGSSCRRMPSLNDRRSSADVRSVRFGHLGSARLLRVESPAPGNPGWKIAALEMFFATTI